MVVNLTNGSAEPDRTGSTTAALIVTDGGVRTDSLPMKVDNGSEGGRSSLKTTAEEEAGGH